MNAMGKAQQSGQEVPPRKRVKVVQEAPSTKLPNRLFAPFRALGLVTNDVPFALQTRSYKGATEGPRLHILTCFGRSWALWEGGKMTLLFMGTDTPTPISSLTMNGDAIWVTCGPHALKYLRGNEVTRLANPFGTALSTVDVFGNDLLCLTEDGTQLLIWDLSDGGDKLSRISFDNTFTATTVLHPATYINKVLIASGQGGMQLWNIRTQTCIFKFNESQLRDVGSDHNPCAITSLVQSPAIDVVGIGFSTGEISIYDIRADERLMRIFMDGGAVTSLSFRSDGQQVLASASSSGHIALWDLNAGGRLLHLIRGAHDSSISKIEWVPNQPVLISSSGDNSVKQWFFESTTTAPRLLKFRSGHRQPPNLIRYYGEDGKQILTASQDRSLRYTSVVRDSRSFELSQGQVAKKATTLSVPLAHLKLPPITAMSHSSARSKDWDDVLTAHSQETFSRTWSVQNKKLGKWSMSVVDSGNKKSKSSPGSVKAVCVTACGNFGLAASSTGTIQMWNMQSGIKRKSFEIGPRPSDHRSASPSTERVVNGLATDSLNRTVIASTQDGTINFFNFHTTVREYTMSLPAQISSIQLNRDSNLLAVICDDLIVRLVDIETKRVVREMTGFRGRVLDITFSPDSRWLITTSLDCMIRTFDIPTGRLVDAFRTSSVATSVTFSPSNDFLATSHVDSVGVYLWANRAQYTDVSLQGVVEDEQISEVALPSVQGTVEDEALEALSSLVPPENTNAFTTPTQLEGDLITLTLLPRARWQTLINLDIINKRNKPKEPPKAPEKAPFFLPTLPGVEHRFAINQTPEHGSKEIKKTRLEAGATQAESIFYKKLTSEDPEGNYEGLFSYIKTLSPAAIDLELRSIASIEGFSLFLGALSQRLRSHRDFEAVQAFIHVFLRTHGDILILHEELQGPLETLKRTQREESQKILELVTSSLGTLGFVRDIL